MMSLWLSRRWAFSGKALFDLPTGLAVLGMVIGIASLVLSMAVVSGYETTLIQSVQNTVGHLIVMKRGSADQSGLLEDLKPVLRDSVAASTPFVYAEALIAHQGRTNGIVVEGVDPLNVDQVLDLPAHIVAGSFAPFDDQEVAGAVIGKGLANRFNLQIGDTFRVVVPLTTDFKSVGFRPKLQVFRVAGVLNFGRHDFDHRYVISHIRTAQRLAELGDRITGYRLRLKDPYLAISMSHKIAADFGYNYFARDWRDVNRNLFEAISIEKRVIFFVLLIIVVAACFNIAGALYLSVVKRYRDVSILKTLGVKRSAIRNYFIVQGLIIGMVGVVLGVVIGLGLCQVFYYSQDALSLMPSEVYKLDHIALEVRWMDLLAIFAATFFVCLIATLSPAWRGAKLSPVEGLRYE